MSVQISSNPKMIFLITIVLVVTGCAKGFQSSSRSGKADVPPTVVCPMGPEVNPASGKLLTDTAGEQRFFNQNKVSGISPSSRDKLAKTNEAWTAVLDIDCVIEGRTPTYLEIIESAPQHSAKSSLSESFRVKIKPGFTPAQIELMASRDSCLVGLNPEIEIHKAEIPNDPFLTSQSYLSAVGYQHTLDFFDGLDLGPKNDVIVAIIDDGMDLNHIELKDRLWVNMAELNGTAGVDDDKNGYIDDIHGFDFASNSGDPAHKNSAFHGTHVAGLIGAATNNGIGIASLGGLRVKFMVLNIFGANDSSSNTLIDKAVRYAADNGARIVNMSIVGSGKTDSTGLALAYALSKGVVVTAAAGNEGVELSNSNFVTPASFAENMPGIISVAAVDSSNANNLCSFSNFSSVQVKIGAPGCDTRRTDEGIFSTLPGDKGGYLAGTSMATPIVAGAAAMVYGLVRDNKGISLAPPQIEDLLVGGGKSVATLTTKIKMGHELDLATLAPILENQYFLASGACQ